jgi:EAL domain-containing protein (putative c-di-GMP-specific phosphodiesterase class I)
MPDRFIDLAEASGLIDPMTEWALREALAQIARWRSAGLDTRVAVNVSMASLDAPDFANRVSAIVKETGMQPRDLILEVTESRLGESSTTPLENLVRLRVQRFGLSIDDFGTGHSSLAQLRDIPFTELKVDRGFVRGARTNAVIRPILEGSIEMARRLGMQSVAEGVETQDDWRLLQEVGCHLAQGYFIARPMPPEQVVEWLAAWAARRPALVADPG